MININEFDKIIAKDKKWVSNIRKERYDEFKSLSLPKWKRIRLDDFSFPQYKSYNKKYIDFDKKEEGIIVEDINEGLNNSNYLKEYMINEVEGFIDSKFKTYAESLYNSGIFVYAKRNSKTNKPIRINYEMDNEDSLVNENNIIIAEDNSEINLVFDYYTDKEVKAFHNGNTKVFVKNGAVVNMVKIQRMNDISNHFDNNIAIVESYGEVNWITVEIGCKVGVSNYTINLNGDNSKSEVYSLYFGDGNRSLDLGFTMNHRGIRSISKIDSRGALKDSAKKVFRGNLDFKLGSKKSRGSEKEYVLLLDKSVKSDAIPALLCSEDDVEGEHAASAGQIDENKLYYLMSRGFNEIEAKKLIIEASFNPIIDRIPLDYLKDIVRDEVNRRLVYG